MKESCSGGAEGTFTRSHTYRSLRNMAPFTRKGEESGDIPPASSLPPDTKRGFLWKLSGRRMLYRTDWKRKYFILHRDILYYYESKEGKGSDKGSGLIELKYFTSCVEAPLTDHKKATNVFLLLAAERGFFDQGRCYLSAETLIDMKDWVNKIKTVLEGGHKTGGKERDGPVSPPGSNRDNRVTRRESLVPEPLYASIKEESIHRSNSMSTIPSLCRDQLGESKPDWLNRSMEEGPVCGLGGLDHNLTYNYSSSSEDSLNESFSIVIGQKLPRSAESSMRRPRHKPEITLHPHSPPSVSGYEDVVPPSSSFLRHSSPVKKVPRKNSSDYLERMYSDMDRVDKQLEMVASRVSTDGGSISGISTISQTLTSSQNTPVSDDQGSSKSLHKMERMLKQVVRQSEELYGVFRQLESESTQGGHKVESEDGVSTFPGSQVLGDRLARYQDSLVMLERQATDLMEEIRETHTRVVKSLEEAEKARKDFLQLKEKAEYILTQLQGEAFHRSTKLQSGMQYSPSSTVQTFPKQKKSLVMAQSQPGARGHSDQDPSFMGSHSRVNFILESQQSNQQPSHHPSHQSNHHSSHYSQHPSSKASGPHSLPYMSGGTSPHSSVHSSPNPSQHSLHQPLYSQPVKKADREKEKQEVYSKPSYEVQSYRGNKVEARRGERGSPEVQRYTYNTSTYSPKNERYSPHKSPLAQEERYSPIKSPLGQEEMYSPQHTHRSNTKTSPVRNSSVMSPHRHETDNFRPRSLVFSTPVKKE